jgi:predicted permease
MTWMKRLANLFRVGSLDRELDEEMRFHLEMRAAQYEKEGLAPEEARREALKRFGSPLLTRDRVRDVRLFAWLDSVRQDAWLGARMLRRSPMLALAALLSLGLGIGATTGVFAVGDALMFRPLPVDRPGELVAAQWRSTEWPDLGIWGTNDADNNTFSFSYPIYERLVTTPGIDLAGEQDLNRGVLSIRGNASNADGALVTGNFFRVLGVAPAAGRMFEEADNRPTAEPVIVISHRLWEQAFAGDPAAVGSPMRVNGQPFTVVGVAPKTLFGTLPGRWSDFYVPACWLPKLRTEFTRDSPLTSERFWWLQLFGRPKPGASIQAIQAAMTTRFDASVKPLIKDPKQHAHFSLRSAAQGFAFEESESYRPIGILMSLVVLVLLVACSNVANLLLARGAARQKESAMRLALGAGRWRLVRQHLTESFVLAVTSGLAGYAFAGWFAQTILAMSPGQTAVEIDFGFSWRVVGFAGALTAIAGLLVGLAPAVALSRSSVAQALRSGATVRPGWRRHRFGLSRPLVAVQIALSLVVLVVAGLFVRTLGNLQAVPVGLNPDHVVLFTLDPTAAGYTPVQKAAATERIASRLRQTTNVRAVSWSSFALLDGLSWNTLVKVQDDPKSKRPPCNLLWVEPGFHRLLQIPLVAGRLFDGRDGGSAPKVAIVNQSFVAKYLNGRSPLGETFSADLAGQEERFEIVGVVRDGKYARIRRPVGPVAYFPDAQHALPEGPTFALKVAGDPALVTDDITRTVHELEPALPVSRIRTFEQQISRQLAVERSLSLLASAFGIVALLLAAVGLYGVLAFAVARRTAEMGVRLALGASRAAVLGLIMADSAKVVLPGTCVGLASALAAARLVESQLFGLKPTDPLTVVAAVALILAVAALAAFIPARRAAAIDPVEALRCE